MKLVKPTHFASHRDVLMAIIDALVERGIIWDTSMYFDRFSSPQWGHTRLDYVFKFANKGGDFILPSSLNGIHTELRQFTTNYGVLDYLGEERIMPPRFSEKLNFEAILQMMRMVNVLCFMDVQTRRKDSTVYCGGFLGNGLLSVAEALNAAIENCHLCKASELWNSNHWGCCLRGSFFYGVVYYDANIGQLADLLINAPFKNATKFSLRVHPKLQYPGRNSFDAFAPYGIITNTEACPIAGEFVSGQEYRIQLMSSGPEIPEWLFEQVVESDQRFSAGYYPNAIADFRCDDGFTFFDLS